MKKIIITGIYTKSYKDVLNLQKKSCKDNYIFDYRFISDEVWEKSKTSKEFAFFGGNTLKTQLVIDKIKQYMGGIIIVADADLVFFKETQEQILTELQDYDTLFLKERLDLKNPYERAKSNINIGFVIIKCNEKNLKFWEEIQQKTIETSGWDQEIANILLQNSDYDLKWNHLSDSFANGGCICKHNIKKVLIGTSCGTVAKKYNLSKLEYLKNLIKYSKPKNFDWFDKIKVINGKKYLFGLIQTEENENEKKYYILNKNIYEQEKKSLYEKLCSEFSKKLDRQYYLQKSNIHAAAIHKETFGEFRNKHQGESLVVCGCGPTFNKYSPIEGAYHIGVNRAFLNERIDFDYLFAQDYLRGSDNDMENAANYKKESCIKFYGIIPEFRRNQLKDLLTHISHQEICRANARPFILEDAVCRNFAQYLDFEPMGDFKGCIFSALQFALYTNPAKLYIVGCDCSNAGHFHAERANVNNSTSLSYQMKSWLMFAEFAKKYYPNTEIISVNPIGLKGLFKDFYTTEYIEEHPEILNENFDKIIKENSFSGLNLGAGNWYKKDWAVVDWYAKPQFIDYKINLLATQELPLEDNSLKYVFSSHLIEHLTDENDKKLFSEVYRILGKEGVFRIACPDAEKAFEAYKNNDKDFFFANDEVYLVGETLERRLVNFFASFKCHNYNNEDVYVGGPVIDDSIVKEKLQSLTQTEFISWCVSLIPKEACYVAHINGFNYDKLEKMLKECGFKKVMKSSYQKSEIKEMQEDCFDNRPLHSLFVEATK